MRAPREGVPPVVWRVAGEAAFLIAAAVVVGVAKLDWWLIVLIMAGAFAIVLLIEWIAGREQYAPPRMAAPPPVFEGETVGERTSEEDALGWTAFEEAQEPSDAMTIVGAPPAVEEAEPQPDEEAPEAQVQSAVEAEPEPEPEPESEPEPELPPAAHAAPEPEDESAPRRRWWRRQPDEADVAEEPEAHEPPRHVRVLPPDEEPGPTLDAWESGFDEPDEQTDDDVAADIGEDTAEGEPAVTVDGEASERRRFRRR
jgi:hypothetical protein